MQVNKIEQNRSVKTELEQKATFRMKRLKMNESKLKLPARVIYLCFETPGE